MAPLVAVLCPFPFSGAVGAALEDSREVSRKCVCDEPGSARHIPRVTFTFIRQTRELTPHLCSVFTSEPATSR